MINLRHRKYKMFIIQPLHVDMDPIQLPVENLTLDQVFTPKYIPQEVYVRMDPIVTYKNTARSIRIGFSCQSHHFFDGEEGSMPGAVALIKDKKNNIFQYSKTFFGPGDNFCSMWDFNDLLPLSKEEWTPKYKY